MAQAQAQAGGGPGAFSSECNASKLRRESRPRCGGAVEHWNEQRRQGEGLEAQEALLHLLLWPAPTKSRLESSEWWAQKAYCTDSR